MGSPSLLPQEDAGSGVLCQHAAYALTVNSVIMPVSRCGM
jgi:hypothetical protein